MAQEYTVWAKSPSLNQEIRQFDLTGGAHNAYTDQNLAARDAASFAQRLNATQHLRTNDWEAWVKYEQVGIETLPGYISHTGM